MSINKIKSYFIKPLYDFEEYTQEVQEEDISHERSCTDVMKSPLDMTRYELIEYARDMYGLKCGGMHASTIVKKLYEHIHGVEKRGPYNYTKKVEGNGVAEAS